MADDKDEKAAPRSLVAITAPIAAVFGAILTFVVSCANWTATVEQQRFESGKVALEMLRAEDPRLVAAANADPGRLREARIAFAGTVAATMPFRNADAILGAAEESWAGDALTVEEIRRRRQRLRESQPTMWDDLGGVLRYAGLGGNIEPGRRPPAPRVEAPSSAEQARPDPAPQASPAAAACAPQKPAETGRTIQLFAHIGRREDRTAAAALLQRVLADSGFTLQGIEYVPGWDAKRGGDVRYYAPGDCGAARWLASALGAGVSLNLVPLYENPRFANLPAGRMEVWLPPLPP